MRKIDGNIVYGEWPFVLEYGRTGQRFLDDF